MPAGRDRCHNGGTARPPEQGWWGPVCARPSAGGPVSGVRGGPVQAEHTAGGGVWLEALPRAGGEGSGRGHRGGCVRLLGRSARTSDPGRAHGANRQGHVPATVPVRRAWAGARWSQCLALGTVHTGSV